MLTVYKASAGSGKTFTLAFEYIKTLLGLRLPGGSYVLNSDRYAPGGRRLPRRHAAILAITFTNAATEEMKSRIIRQLNTLSDTSTMDGTPYAAMLCGKNGYGCTREELSHAARLALTELLHDYNSFNVSTIDSFFQTVLRTFSREIDHQGDYELSLEREDMIRQAISLMLDELNSDEGKANKRLYAWIHEYVKSKIIDGTGYNFFNRDGKILSSLSSDIDRSMDETFVENATALDEYLADASKLESFRKALSSHICGAFEAAAAAARRLYAFRDTNGLPGDYFGSLESRMQIALDPKTKISSKAFDIKQFKTPVDELELSHFLKKANIKATPDALQDQVLGLFKAFVKELPAAVKRRQMYQDLLEATGQLDFIGQTRKRLRDLMKDSNMMLISDTSELLSRIISDAEMPFIYERLGMQLENLLIDEFQDTSRLQWRNLRPLVANSLSYDYDNLIIGDVKQSIYRFRNSDSELLGSVVETVDFPRQSRSRGSDPADNTNHRSAGDIVRFNNEIFARMSESLGVKHYGEVRQAVAAGLDRQPAYIKLHFHNSATETETLVLEEMAQDIIRQHEAGYRWRDIMILARRRKEATAIVRYLTETHPEIRLLSNEALLLCSSPAVRSIISALKLVARSYEGKKSTRGDNAPQYATKGDIVMMITRYNYFYSQGYEPMTALNMALEESSGTSEHIQSEVDIIRSKNPANLVALIEAAVALRLSPEQRESEYAYIAALQDLAMKHLEGPDPSLAAFLAAYDRNEQSWAILAPSSLDAVEIMTVHKSKGLERACVHIPFGDWELRHGNKKMWIRLNGFEDFDDDIVPPIVRVPAGDSSPFADPELSPVADAVAGDNMAERMDNLNTAYVAFTRAARELIIHADISGEGTGAEFHSAFLDLNSAGILHFEKQENETCGKDDIEPADEYYLLGAPTSPENAGDAPDNTLDAGEYEVRFRDDTREIVSIDDILAADDDLGDEEDKEIVDAARPFTGTAEMREASRKGVNMHAILAGMRTVDDLDASIARTCTRIEIPESERNDYRRDICRAFETAGSLALEWFDPANAVYPERSFYDPETGGTSRPDRIVIRPDGRAVIVDYKFTTEVRASHRRQVSAYRRLLAATGHPEVDVYLWYPLLGQIIKV